MESNPHLTRSLDPADGTPGLGNSARVTTSAVGAEATATGVGDARQQSRLKRLLDRLSPPAAATVQKWRPAGLDAEQRAALPMVMSHVRCWVATAEPATAKTARTLLWATTRLAVWAHLVVGSVDPTIVLHPHNIQHFVSYVSADESPAWRHAMRSALTRVGRAVNPDGWAPLLPQFGRKGPPAPYSHEMEAGFGLAAVMPGRPHRAARMWVVCAGFGLGLRGPEIALAGPHDFVSIIGGRLAVRVGGRNPRLVPLRAAYTDMALRTAQAADGDRFITAQGKGAVHSIAERLAFAEESLSLRRARNTWLTAHLQAGTPLPALRVLAGPMSATTLNALLDHVVTTVSADEAIMQGLRA